MSQLETSPVVKTLLIQAMKQIKTKAWDERGWPARLALAGLTAGVGGVGLEGAGIAAMGGAIGLPLFLRTSAGGALLGSIIQELEKTQNK